MLIDSIVCIVSVAFLVEELKNNPAWLFSNAIIALISIMTAVLVNTVKLIRMYIILYGNGLKGKDIILLYAKTAIVSCILPFKLGDVYRMYYLGRKIEDYRKGIIITLLDRFMDTIGIFIIMGVGILLRHEKYVMNPVVALLVIFMVCAIIFYVAVPRIAEFWKKQLLHNRGSVHRLWGLELISRTQSIFTDVKKIIEGRGILLVICSTVAWLLEIGSVSLIHKTQLMEQTTSFSAYINSILMGEYMTESARYTVMSIGVLIVVYLFVALKIRNTTNHGGIRCKN